MNPNLPGERFASKSLAGRRRGVLRDGGPDARACAKRASLPDGDDANPADLLDLVALGTVADLVPLDLNNRILVAQGLRRIRAGRCAPGLRALLEVAGRDARRRDRARISVSRRARGSTRPAGSTT